MEYKCCVDCKNYDTELFTCLRDAEVDLVTGSRIGGQDYVARYERYPSSHYVQKMISILSDYDGPCGEEGEYFVAK